MLVKDEENNKIKKHLKFTRIQELEIEKKAYFSECTRLKNLLSAALNDKMQVLMYSLSIAIASSVNYYSRHKRNETDYQKLEVKFSSLNNEAEQLKADIRDKT